MRTPGDRSKFAAFILTHGRPDRVVTYRSLRRHGYTGPIWLVVDDEDPTREEYERRFPGEVIVFSKADYRDRVDTMDAEDSLRGVIYARVANWDIAERLGLDYFLQLDDDYSTFIHRLRGPGPGSRFGVSYGSSPIRDFDAINLAMLRLLDDTGCVSVAFSQGGDHIGGYRSGTLKAGYKRKAMNSFYFRTDTRMGFAGRLNEDCTAYAIGGTRGELYLTVINVQLEQTATQQNAGGLTDAYLDAGTYVKSFYTLMMCPSFTTIQTMGRTDRRLHHKFRWRNAIPAIVAPELRRG